MKFIIFIPLIILFNCVVMTRSAYNKDIEIAKLVGKMEMLNKISENQWYLRNNYVRDSNIQYFEHYKLQY